MDDLDFLETYWVRVNTIGEKIKKELPFISSETKMFGNHLQIVQFKDLENWSLKPNGKSDSLVALADKINTMIHSGRAKDVKPMVMKIVSGRIKKLTKPIGRREILFNMENPVHGKYTAEFLGHGHFRWNYRAYSLTEIELKRLKEYFGI